MSSEETKYIHHSLSIDPAEVTVANEVSAEVEIAIELGKPFWVGHGGTENPVPWEDQKHPGG